MDELRRTHNQAKRELIMTWVKPGANCLDCGCGRGGDLWKWKAVDAKLAAIDPDAESLLEAEERARSIGIDVWFLGQGDIRQAAFAGPFEVVCYNFAIQYIVDCWEDSLAAIDVALVGGGLLIGITPTRAAAEALAGPSGKFQDRLGNEFHIKNDRMLVRLSDGPFYADGPKEEPLMDASKFHSALTTLGFERLVWEPMLIRPNGLISDLYSKFVYRKVR
jgi:SAM-dependent methyltransferase